MRATFVSLLALALSMSQGGAARAQAVAGVPGTPDRYNLSVHGETHATLFQRALLPGAYGAIVTDDTLLPVYQYVQLSARDQRIVSDGTGLDLELSAWSRGELGSTRSERGADGDVQTANVGYHRGPFTVRIGRQQVAGGAARYTRLDGVVLDAELGAGFDARIYTGLSVLPRWNERPAYTYLGAAADSRLKDPALTDTRQRSDFFLGGGRLGFTAGQARLGVSFHEQHESGGLGRRTLSLDGSTHLSTAVSAGASASAELDAERLAEARAWLDATPLRELDLELEWLHTEPALFLSRQSVLSVFSTADYDEGGAHAVARAGDRITLEAGSWAELYSGSRPGARAEVATRVIADAAGKSTMRLAYARVLTPDNGYHSLRSTLTQRIVARLSGTLEAYAYLYDHAIRGYRSSTVYSGTLEYRPARGFGVLWGASLMHSPYANLDAQTQLRVAYDFDFATTRGGR